MKRLQNKIAESRWALPLTAIYAAVTWLAKGDYSRGYIIQAAMFALSAYLMVELNNRNTLIRIYSRMVSCAFLVLGGMMLHAFGSPEMWFVQLCFVAAYFMLFPCCREKEAQGRMFYAFFFIGAASLAYPQSLFFAPVMWLLTATNLMAFSGRNLMGALVGLVTPYWFLAGYCLFKGDIAPLTQIIRPDTWWQPVEPVMPDYATMATVAFIAATTVIGAIHFIRNSYNDKIRTRMTYNFIIIMSLAVAALVVLQPHNVAPLAAIGAINASVLIAHFTALTKTRITNIAFLTLTAVAVGITIFNLWTHL